jgi:lysophospholipase L1-like esterase
MFSKLNNFVNQRRGPLRCIALGDSVTQNDSFEAASGLWTEGNGYFERCFATERRTERHPAGNYVFVRNAGIGGNTTPDMLARLDTDVLAYNPDVMFLMAGTNDILPGAVDADYAAFFTALEKIIVRAQLAGVNVILSTCPTKNAAPAEVARAIPWYYMLAKHYGIPLIDAHRVTADPVTGQYKTGYSDDGTHPNVSGIAAIVSLFAQASTSTGGRCYRSVVATATPRPDNLILNGCFVKNTVPPAMDNWSCQHDWRIVYARPRRVPHSLRWQGVPLRRRRYTAVCMRCMARTFRQDQLPRRRYVLVFSGLLGFADLDTSPIPASRF